jgi:hypothetical protein
VKKGCLISLIVWAGSAAAYWYFLHARLTPPADRYVPIAAGFVMMIAFAQLNTAFLHIREARKVGERPQDGEPITAVGRIRATGETLHAPFSGRAAVCYSYDIKDPAGTNKSRTNNYAGFALTPSSIDTPSGAIRLLGFPVLEGFAKEQLHSDVAMINARSYIASTQFLDMSGMPLTTVFREMKEIFTDDDGQVRKDWRMGDDPHLHGKQLFEQIVEPGTEVCAIGRYSTQKGGIVPDFAGGNVVRLLRGDASSIVRSLRMKATGLIIAAIGIAAAGNGMLYLYVNNMFGR